MTPTSAIDGKAFRQALGTFTTGVTIITTLDQKGLPIGVTANSFNSVSLDPPLVLWSLARKAYSLSAFEEASHWAVHVLASDQQDLSDRFARRGEDKFAGLPVQAGAGGVPLISGCMSRFQCRATHRYEGGDHLILVGEVVAFDQTAKPPLVFHKGGYAVAAPRTSSFADSVPQASFGEDFLDYLLPRAHYQIYAGIRALVQQHGLSDAEWFIVSSLTAKDERSFDDLARMYGITGQALSMAMINRLQEHQWLSLQPAGAKLVLTPTGRQRAVEVLAAAKAQEAAIIDQLGEAEADALKALLRQLIRVTDPGLPDMWGRDRS